LNITSLWDLFYKNSITYSLPYTYIEDLGRGRVPQLAISKGNEDTVKVQKQINIFSPVYWLKD
jgi:hypothetical protein